MVDLFAGRFQNAGNLASQGSQGAASRAIDRSTGAVVFLKRLRRQHSLKARKRFRREVAAYETLPVAGVPRLVFDNSDQWEDRHVELGLVLEWIDGESLRDRIAERGPMDAREAVNLTIALCNILADCHKAGVIHRDIKPANVMLRAGSTGAPVLVDFGLSFNDADVSDLTEDEELGNRFLRLPEYHPGELARGWVGDVTQLAGLLLFCLTGCQPHVLVNDKGQMPHQRDEPLRRLTEAFADAPQALLRVRRLFDRTFTVRADRRVATAAELHALLDALFAERDPNMDHLDAQFKAALSDASVIARAGTAARLEEFLSSAYRTFKALADESGLAAPTWGFKRNASAEPPSSQAGLGLSQPGVDFRSFPHCEFRFESRGDEIVLLVDGCDQWRGSDPDDPQLRTVIERAVKTIYIRYLQGH